MTSSGSAPTSPTHRIWRDSSRPLTIDGAGYDGLVDKDPGASSAIPFDQQTESAWDDDLDLKLRAAIRTIRLVLPYLRTAGGGSIINVLNTAARAPGAGSTPTSVSRAAGLALTKALSKELGPDLIRVNAILVGIVQSGRMSPVA